MDAISGNLVLDISDRLPQFLIVDDVKVNYKILNYFKNDYSKFNEEKFINDFLHIDWISISDNELDTSAKFDFFYDKICHLVNVHVPCRKLSKNEIKLSTKPWITQDILAKVRHRDKLYFQVNKCKQSNPNLIALHKKFRNSVVTNIKASKTNYLKKYFLCNSNNIKKIWSGIRSIINISKVKADFIPILNENGKVIDNLSAIANIFNNFFVDVGINTGKGIPPGNCPPASFLKGTYSESMFLSPVTPNEVQDYNLK